MKISVCVMMLLAVLATASGQNQQGAPAIYSSITGNISPSTVWLDASQFNQGDVCKGIQSAIASLPATAVGGGVVIDARNYPVSSSSSTLTCTVNPFTINTNPLQLAFGGTGTNSGSGGGVVLLPGATILLSVPWVVPGNWSVYGEGAGVTVLKAGFTVPVPSGALSTSLSSTTISGNSSANWNAGYVGLVLLVCPTVSCTANPTNAQVVGIVTAFPVLHTLTIGSGAQLGTSAGSNGYIFQAPLISWATTAACTSGCSGALQTSTFGSVIQDVGLNCNLVTNCVPFWDQYGQERSQLKRVDVTNFSSIGIGIYTATAQNGGPFEDIQMAPGATATCVEVGGTGVGGPPPMRGIRGFTCTGSGSGTGVDINTQNFDLLDAHFESLGVGIEVGSLTAAAGISIINITGGGSMGSAVSKIVDISSLCATNAPTACNSATTANINVRNIFSPFSPTSSQRALVDNITNNTTNEATLAFYSLGDGSGSSGSSTRPLLTTSSTFASAPNLLGMAAATPITGVRGSTGTLIQMSAGPAFTSGDLLQSDSHSNTVDSGVPAANLAGTVTFFTNAYGLGTTSALANTTVKLWGFSLPNAITTGALVLDVTTTDNTGNLYDIGVYDSGGNRVVHVGATAGSVLFGAASGSKAISWAASTTLTPGKYYFATATNCTTTCAVLGGINSGTFASAAGGGAATGGALPTTISPPGDSWAVAPVPSFTIH